MTFGLRTYLALTRARDRTGNGPAAPQDHPSIWMHLAHPSEVGPALAWFQRLCESYGEITLVLTGTDQATDTPGVQTSALPDDTSGPVSGFLDRWRPALCIWSGNRLRPRLLWQQTQGHGPAILIHASDTPFLAPRPFWGAVAPAVLPLFSDVFAQDTAAHTSLAAQVGPGTRLHPGGRLQSSLPPLPVRIPDLERRAMELSGRPVWLATGVTPPELEPILRAHRRVSRMAHRLLLILAPDPTTPVEAVQTAAGDIGLRARVLGDVALSDDALQVVIAPDPALSGLLYRLAPITFLGGSMSTFAGGTDPYQAAALGSAILYGPHVHTHAGAYRELAQAGAAVLVRNTDGLAQALTAVLAADEAARMAHAGWEVLSAGAPLADALTALALSALDRAEAA